MVIVGSAVCLFLSLGRDGESSFALTRGVSVFLQAILSHPVLAVEYSLICVSFTSMTFFFLGLPFFGRIGAPFSSSCIMS